MNIFVNLCIFIIIGAFSEYLFNAQWTFLSKRHLKMHERLLIQTYVSTIFIEIYKRIENINYVKERKRK